MGDWNPSAGQAAMLGKVKIGESMGRLVVLADEITAKMLDQAARRQALKQAETVLEAVEADLLLSGTVVGKNAEERKASLVARRSDTPTYSAAWKQVQELESDVAILAAEIAGLEAQATALRMDITGKAAVLNFLGSTSS